MTYVDLINPEKWYDVPTLSLVIGWSEDTIYRWIEDDLLPAFIAPRRNRRKSDRTRRSMKVLGAEVIRFLERYMTC